MKLFHDNCLGAKLIESEIEYGTGWVVVVGCDVVAYLLARFDGYMVDITRVGVLPEHQRIGHATNLLNRAIENIPSAMLTVKKDNVKARRLYCRLGFNIVGDTGFGSWVMHRTTSGGTSPSRHNLCT